MKRGLIDKVHDNGQTLLTTSILYNDHCLMAFLLNNGANIRQKDGMNRNILHIIAINDNASNSFGYFLGLGISDLLEEKDNNGESVLDIIYNLPDSIGKHLMMLDLNSHRTNNEDSLPVINKDQLDECDKDRIEHLLLEQKNRNIKAFCTKCIEEPLSKNLISNSNLRLKKSKPWSLGELVAASGIFVAIICAYMKYQTPVEIDIEQKEQAE